MVGSSLRACPPMPAAAAAASPRQLGQAPNNEPPTQERAGKAKQRPSSARTASDVPVAVPVTRTLTSTLQFSSKGAPGGRERGVRRSTIRHRPGLPTMPALAAAPRPAAPARAAAHPSRQTWPSAPCAAWPPWPCPAARREQGSPGSGQGEGRERAAGGHEPAGGSTGGGGVPRPPPRPPCPAMSRMRSPEPQWSVQRRLSGLPAPLPLPRPATGSQPLLSTRGVWRARLGAHRQRRWASPCCRGQGRPPPLGLWAALPAGIAAARCCWCAPAHDGASPGLRGAVRGVGGDPLPLSAAGLPPAGATTSETAAPPLPTLLSL